MEDPGQRVRRELGRACAADQVHGAYLLERGTEADREATAAWFARRLLCRAAGDEPCGHCPDCRKLASTAGGEDGAGEAGGHPDVKHVRPDGAQIKVAQIRGLQRELSLVANEGGRRVGLIHDADRLGIEAANALLKLLEEPPPATVLVLIADSAERLPATVRSRTVRIRFAAMPEAELQEALEAEGFEARDAWLAATLGGGAPDPARDWAAESLDDARALCELIEGIERLGASAILDAAESFRGAGADTRARAALLLAVHGAVARRRVEEASAAGDAAALERWVTRFEAGEHARREMQARNLNPQLVIEGLLMDLRASAASA